VIVLETERLVLRHVASTDAPFVLELLNDPDWLRYIGDRDVRTLGQAADYIQAGPARMYAQYGFGLYLTALKTSTEAIGLCGLLKRDFLEDVDIGFAFLPRYRAEGYAFEAASGILHYAQSVLALNRVVAIVTTDNHRSARLLEKLGFRFERMVTYPGEADQLRLFACSLHSQVPETSR
jgi:RimJ/RimL family protein N-acetyltransferase